LCMKKVKLYKFGVIVSLLETIFSKAWVLNSLGLRFYYRAMLLAQSAVMRFRMKLAGVFFK